MEQLLIPPANSGAGLHQISVTGNVCKTRYFLQPSANFCVVKLIDIWEYRDNISTGNYSGFNLADCCSSSDFGLLQAQWIDLKLNAYKWVFLVLSCFVLPWSSCWALVGLLSTTTNHCLITLLIVVFSASVSSVIDLLLQKPFYNPSNWCVQQGSHLECIWTKTGCQKKVPGIKTDLRKTIYSLKIN